MPSASKFLVVDDNADSRFWLVKTLLRKFPRAVVQETRDGEAAVGIARAGNLSALIVHRAAETDGLTLVRMLREAAPTIPIVMVSGLDRTAEALAAGANTFLNYEAWLRIGTVVDELIEPQRTNSNETASPAET
jgi:CheY-like chemotaxis protein